MTVLAPSPVYRAPKKDGAIFCQPAWESMPALARQNRQHQASTDAVVWAGVPVGQLKNQLRQQLLESSLPGHADHFSNARPEGTWWVTGHQPELFHSGVWAKNAATAGWAQAQATSGALGLFIEVDSDTLESPVVPVPSQTPAEPALEYIAFDQAGPAQPFETRAVRDETVFKDFPNRVTQALEKYPFQPVVAELWNNLPDHGLLADRLSHGRRWLEKDLGGGLAETKISQLATTKAFAHLAAEVVGQAEKFQSIYNHALQQFRRRHGIKSQHHPVPALEKLDDWLELPFWIYRADQPRRARLFARPQGNHVEISRDGQTVLARCPSNALVDYFSHPADDWNIRPRALMSTLFFRFALADVFLHGIGGAVYDQMTDALAQEFWGVTPPAFAVLSGTWHLPLEEVLPDWNQTRHQQLKYQQRDVHYNPERYLSETLADQEPLGPLIEEKFELQQSRPTQASDKRARFQRFHQINAELRPYLGRAPAELAQAYRASQRALEIRDLLMSREFSYVLFPKEKLQRIFQSLLSSS